MIINYRGGGLNKILMPAVVHRLRQWDVTSAWRLDGIVSNSKFVEKRVRKTWGRASRVVYPPVSVDEYIVSDRITEQYLWVGQMTPYKRADIALSAFNRLGVPALMVGDGEMFKKISAQARPNVTVRKKMSFSELKSAYATCKGLIFTAEEDFGIIPVEANASGRPVLAYGSGGVLDSVIDGKTGLFFSEQNVDSLIDGLERLEDWVSNFQPADAIKNANRFRVENFTKGFCDALLHFSGSN